MGLCVDGAVRVFAEVNNGNNHSARSFLAGAPLWRAVLLHRVRSRKQVLSSRHISSKRGPLGKKIGRRLGANILWTRDAGQEDCVLFIVFKGSGTV